MEKPTRQNEKAISRANANISISVHEPTPEELRQQQYDTVREIKKLRDASFPSKNGLRPHEILMLSYAPKFHVGQKNFQQFWYYKYAVSNPNELLESLVSKGFIRKCSAVESLGNLKVPELKAILSESGLKATGKKPDLILRITNEVAPDAIERNVNCRNYALTELGKTELQENEYVIYMHGYRYSNISVWTINKAMQGYPARLWRDRIWAELNRLQLEAFRDIDRGNYSPYVSIRYQQADFLIEEKRYGDAITIILDALDKSLNYIAAKRFELEIEFRKTGFKSGTIPSYAELVNDCCGFGFRLLQRILDAFSPSKPYDILISETYDSLKIKKVLLSKDEFISILQSQITGDMNTFLRVCNNVQKRLL